MSSNTFQQEAQMLTILIAWFIMLGGAFFFRYSVFKRPLPVSQAVGVATLLFLVSIVFTFIQPGRQHAAMLLGAFLAYSVLRKRSSNAESIRDEVEVNEVASDGSTPLMMAAMLGKVGEIGKLLASGAVLNAVDQRGWSALMHAAFNNEVDAVQLLLKSGADQGLTNSDGLTALDIALASESLDAAEILTPRQISKASGP